MDETVRLVCLSDSHPTFSIKDVPAFPLTRALFHLTDCRAQKCCVENVLELKEFSERVSTL
jgi:hypothetical protein